MTSLNEPCKLEDTSWIKPCRTTFTWWNGNVVPDSTFSPGNNFDTNKYYIDFAARNGLDAHGIYGYAETRGITMITLILVMQVLMLMLLDQFHV